MDFSMNKAQEADEESSWTLYVEDLQSLASVKRNTAEAASSSSTSSSAVSDSVLCAAWKPLKKVRWDSEDDTLEDTACSYANKNSKDKVEDVNGKCRKLKVGRIEETATEERVVLNECSELRKIGLCLVPISVLLNYLG